MTDEKNKIKETLEQMQKQFGEDAIFSGSDKEKLDIEWISTGILDLDLATCPNEGSGGIPKGRIVEVFGPQGSGKTTIALSTMSEAQKDGINCAFFDNENAYNPHYAEMIGVDTEEIYFSKVSEGELTYDMIEALVRSGDFGLIVIDSLAGLAPLPEIQSDMEDQHMGLAGKMNSKAMRKLCGALGKNNCTLFIINQIREKVGQMFGNPEVTPGGRALKFFSDMRLDVRARDKFTEGSGDDKVTYGHRIRIRVVKNKVGTKGRAGFVDLYYDKGFDLQKDLVTAAEKTGVIEVAGGGWTTYIPLGVDPDDKDKVIKVQGTDNFVEKLKSKENSKLLFQEIRERILEGRKKPLYYQNDNDGEEENSDKNKEKREKKE